MGRPGKVAEIAGFFDHVDHHWMMRCLEVRTKDSKLLRVIARMLKAGIMEEEIRPSQEGTPQLWIPWITLRVTHRQRT